MATKKKTLGQKNAARQEVKAEAKKARKAGGDSTDKLVSELNVLLGGVGSVYRGSNIRDERHERRSTGIPTLDYLSYGGFKKGGLHEIGGPYSTGKTTLAIHACARAQRDEPHKAIAWVALEPFDKTWARENGLWIPFSEEVDELGQPYDSYENATETELARMAQLGLTDPYKEICPVVLVQDSRGDVALDATLKLLESNQFSMIVFDSFGVAKSTKWLEEKETQDAEDFPREARMISNYTTRALLTLNRRYDENGQVMKGGAYKNETTLVHLNQIMVNVGTMARSIHKKYEMKGGEANKHNHHIIIFMHRSELLQKKVPGDDRFTYGQKIKAVCIKSKIGKPFREGELSIFFEEHEGFLKGDIDIGEDCATYGLLSGIISRNGAHYVIGEESDGYKIHGREALNSELNNNVELRDWVLDASMEILNK